MRAWPCPHSLCYSLDRLRALRASPLIRFDLGLHIGQTCDHAGIGIEVEDLEHTEAAGTRGTTIQARPRETCSSGLDHGGGELRCAGARASQAKIRLVRRQQRHKTDPKYSPEYHGMPLVFPREEHDARPVVGRLVVSLNLKLVLSSARQHQSNADGIVPLRFKNAA